MTKSLTLSETIDLQSCFINLTSSLECRPKWYDPGRAGGVFGEALTLWLMILQGITGGSFSGVLAMLQRGASDLLLKKNKRSSKAKNRDVSHNTGGYSQARGRLSLELCEEVSELINSGLQCTNRDKNLTYCIDGTYIALEDRAEVVQVYNKRKNQYGEYNYPEMLVVLATGVESGVVAKWHGGGAKESSEQGLSVLVIDSLPSGATIVADRNFGVFSVASHCESVEKKVIVRLTDVRAQSLYSQLNEREAIDEQVVWKKSRHDKVLVPGDVQEVRGRFVKATLKRRGFRDTTLYFFTTTELTVEEILKTYEQRYLIEIDIRYLKGMFKIGSIAARKPDLVKAEILMRICAYNMLRTVLVDLTARINLTPRELSFSKAISCVSIFSLRFLQAKNAKDLELITKQLLVMLRQSKLPRRKRSRTEQRVTRKAHSKFPVIQGKRVTTYE